jgi:transcriptional regulator NrdR family protein
VRFASVYKDFRDIDGFYNELNRIRNAGGSHE